MEEANIICEIRPILTFFEKMCKNQMKDLVEKITLDFKKFLKVKKWTKIAKLILCLFTK